MPRTGLHTTIAIVITTLFAVACGGGAAPPQPSPAQQVPATPAPVTETGEGRPPQPEGNPYVNDRYSYELVVPPGWKLDQRNPKGVVLRLPQKGFFISVAVYGPGDLPPVPATLAGYREAWLTLMRKVMPGFIVVKEEQVTVRQDQGLAYEYTWNDRGTPLRARALLLRRADYGYEVFSWVPEQSWPEFSPLVDGLITSFKLK